MQLDGQYVHERLCRWLETRYIPGQQLEMMLILGKSSCCHITALDHIEAGFDVGKDEAGAAVRYSGYNHYDCDIISPLMSFLDGRPMKRAGALEFVFNTADGKEAFRAVLLSAWINDEEFSREMIAVAAVPRAYQAHWLEFEKECHRIATSAIPFRDKVYIVGGTDVSFDATVEWGDIYLPNKLKDSILKDVDSFFKKGVSIYQRLNIKPFRKLLLAGVPGTGKTMMCSALAKWAQSRDYFVVYVSGSNQYGAKFWKIHQALEMAASSDTPTIVIVEELDAYLDDDSKAQLLNVLDGSETPINPRGTLLLATTNHPENIDDRVMKRPGRLDRIFIIPEMDDADDAEQMLREYMGPDWRDEHRDIIPELLGRPGAFIREVALQALTMAAYDDHDGVPLDVLEQSLGSLVEQIEAKEDFLQSRRRRGMGLLPNFRRNGRRDDDTRH